MGCHFSAFSIREAQKNYANDVTKNKNIMKKPFFLTFKSEHFKTTLNHYAVIISSLIHWPE
jgi:hypothetical protein